jgi:hypothetical protein
VVLLQKELTYTGAFLELLGIILGIYPDLVPFGRQISHGLLTAVDRVCRLFGVHRSVTVTPAAGSAFTGASGVLTLTSSASLELTLKEQVEDLRKKTAALQHEVVDLKAHIAKIQHDWPGRLADLRHGLEATFRQALNAKFDEYRPLRIIGVGALVLGLALSTRANLIE